MTKLKIGQKVINFGELATVIGYHELTGDPILQDALGHRWVADAANCTPAREGLIHKDGLIAIC